MNEVTIANMGLYRVGSSIRITSLDENVERTETVRQCGFWYPIVRDRVLGMAPWGFARKAVQLALVSDTTFPGWQYVYQYPEDCIQAVAVCSAGGMRQSWWFSCWSDFPNSVSVPKVPFQIGSRSGGNSSVIMTDIADAWLYYIFRQTVTTTFASLFVNTFGWEIGAELGAALQVKQDRVDRARQMAAGTRLEAMTQMINEAQQDSEQDSPSILVRG